MSILSSGKVIVSQVKSYIHTYNITLALPKYLVRTHETLVRLIDSMSGIVNSYT